MTLTNKQKSNRIKLGFSSDPWWSRPGGGLTKRVNRFPGQGMEHLAGWLDEEQARGSHSRLKAIREAGRMSKARWARLKAMALKRGLGDLDEAIDDARLAMFLDEKTPAIVRKQLGDTLDNIRGSEEGEYPHLAPAQHTLTLKDDRTPKDLDGVSVVEAVRLLNMDMGGDGPDEES